MPAWIWIVLGLLFLLVLCGGKGSSKGSRGPVRIDRMHYDDVDDYECSVCGARFRKKSMVCPRWGTQFLETKNDDSEFIDEMDFWEDDEEDE